MTRIREKIVNISPVEIKVAKYQGLCEDPLRP